MQKFTSTGAFIDKFGTFGTFEANYKNPNGLCFTRTYDTFLVADRSNHRFVERSLDGSAPEVWGTQGTSDGQLDYPRDVGVEGALNQAFEVDAARVQVFGAHTGAFIRRWGTGGAAPGQFDSPCGIAVDRTAQWVYVADTGNHRVQKFSFYGTFEATWGSYGSGNGQFHSPKGIEVDTDGNVYVADTLNHRVQKFNPTGSLMAIWGSYGTGDGQFVTPETLAVYGTKEVYVADTGNHRIQKFVKQ
ncbi:MAG: SMP-30/gluconolactonase/LRE family protein [Candidatus Margulisiibacteriota bacterium]